MNEPNREKTLGLFLKSGEKVSDTLLESLKDINSKYSKTKCFPDYYRSIQQLFDLKLLTEKRKDYYLFLGGFLEGEGCLNVGAKKNTSSKFRVYFDPEFNVTQHLNGISNLFLAMFVFQTGRIRYKTGSNATFVYTIDNRQTLEEKVIPFYEKYVSPYGSPIKKRRTQIFKQLLLLFQEKAHLNLEQMINEIIPLWALLRQQEGQINQTFKTVLEAQMYVKNAADLDSQNSF
jgi:hypothetical protein